MEYLERHHLRVIFEIERHGTVTKAAKALGLTQPALSHTMKQLELASGAELWRKHGRRLKRTETGDYLLSVATRLLPQFERTEQILAEMVAGHRGSLRIGMECHPCYRWLLKVVSPYLKNFPDVDVDVKQKFQFGGVGALFAHDIDLLVTPDPLARPGLVFVPVFDYEQRLVVSKRHPLAKKRSVVPEDLKRETLITYPVSPDRLDIYSQFLTPAGVTPRKRKVIETTDIMLQMVECERGVTALPHWLSKEYGTRLELRSLRLGSKGINKQIHLGLRTGDTDLLHVKGFIAESRRASHGD